MKIILIRHGKTRGNIEKRYIGSTDESLCETGIKELQRRIYPDAEIVFCSPMKRCLESAAIIYPNKKRLITSDLRECNFGSFEGKNYIELCNDPEYVKWLESGGKMTFPNGEPFDAFISRTASAFKKTADETNAAAAAYIVHGGTIMAVLEQFAVPKKFFYDYQVKNGCGYVCQYENGKMEILEEII